MIALGHIYVRVVLENPITGQKHEDEALVDTGATLTIIPRKIADKLNLKPYGERKVKTACKEQILKETFAKITINDKVTVSPILISNKIDQILIGVITLEALGLKVDPTTSELKETEILLL